MLENFSVEFKNKYHVLCKNMFDYPKLWNSCAKKKTFETILQKLVFLRYSRCRATILLRMCDIYVYSGCMESIQTLVNIHT